VPAPRHINESKLSVVYLPHRCEKYIAYIILYLLRNVYCVSFMFWICCFTVAFT